VLSGITSDVLCADLFWYGLCLRRHWAFCAFLLSVDDLLEAKVKASAEWLALRGTEFHGESSRSGCAHLKHYSVAYREWGDGEPLVLVPGMAGGFDLLEPLARHLAHRFRVISYQLRGEEDPFVLRRRFGLSDLVEDLKEFLEWRCLETPALLGVSFGGVLALEFATRYPNRLSRLIVQGAGARFERGLLQRVAGAVLSGFPLPANNAFVNQFFNLLFGRRQPPGSLFDFVTRQCWQTDQSVMAHRFSLVERYDIAGRLNRIHVPSLILIGDRDLLVSETSLRELCAGIQNHSCTRLQRCGHLAFVTDPIAVSDAVTKFLAAAR
jgi:pimeloyl-ACP methyl ester carboxylesterase